MGARKRAPAPHRPSVDLTGVPVGAVHVVRDLLSSSGGPSRSVTAVCDALAAEGARVTLVSSTLNTGGQLVRPRQPEVAVRLLTADPHAALWHGAGTPYGATVTWALRDSSSSVVHTHGLWVPAYRAAALAAAAVGVPHIVSTKGMLSERALRIKRAKKWIGWTLFQRRVLQGAAAFQATSEDEAEDVRRMGFRQPIAVIPHGVEVPPERPPERPPEERTALFLSRFHPIKGLPDLIEAWDRVRPSGWRLLLVGPDEGGHRDQIAHLVSERQLEATVSLRDSVGESEKQELLAAADLFVLPSHSENFGIVVAEALAAGRPVLTTTGTPWKALRTHDCGWWVAPDATSIAAALQEATSTAPETLQEMGARGRAFVEAHRSWKRSGRDHLALYQWLLGQAPRPGCVHTD